MHRFRACALRPADWEPARLNRSREKVAWSRAIWPNIPKYSVRHTTFGLVEKKKTPESNQSKNDRLLLVNKRLDRFACVSSLSDLTQTKPERLEWRMGNEEWETRNRKYGMGNGEWGMGNGEWEMENKEWGIGNGEKEMVNEEWGMESEE